MVIQLKPPLLEQALPPYSANSILRYVFSSHIPPPEKCFSILHINRIKGEK